MVQIKIKNNLLQPWQIQGMQNFMLRHGGNFTIIEDEENESESIKDDSGKKDKNP